MSGVCGTCGDMLKCERCNTERKGSFNMVDLANNLLAGIARQNVTDARECNHRAVACVEAPCDGCNVKTINEKGE